MFNLLFIKMDGMYLPNEIWTHIIGFITDTTYTSMTSHLFKNLCLKVYEDDKNLYLKNSYNINLFLTKKKIMKIINILCQIRTHNSLNCIFHKIFVKDGECDIDDFDDWYDNLTEKDKMNHKFNKARIIYFLLFQHVKTNNISNPEHLKVMIKMLELYNIPDDEIVNLISEAFVQNNQEMISILMEYKYIKKLWFLSYEERYQEEGENNYYVEYGCRQDMINEIEFVVDGGFFTYLKIYVTFKINKSTFYMHKEILKYLKSKINEKN